MNARDQAREMFVEVFGLAPTCKVCSKPIPPAHSSELYCSEKCCNTMAARTVSKNMTRASQDNEQKAISELGKKEGW